MCTVSWKRPLNLIEQAAHFDEIILLKAVDVVGYVVPHLGVQVAGAVRQRQGQVKLAALLRLGLLGDHDERGGNDLVFKSQLQSEM